MQGFEVVNVIPLTGIYEPCNYVSNFAYYHVVTSICDHTGWSIDPSYTVAMGQAFTCGSPSKYHPTQYPPPALTVGSAFWHGSHTLLGNIADNRFPNNKPLFPSDSSRLWPFWLTRQAWRT